MFDTTLMNLSSKISCENMTHLALKERDRFFYNYTNQFTPRIENENIDRPVNTRVHKKSCVQKKEGYNSGDWINQYNIQTDIPREFNIQTKIK